MRGVARRGLEIVGRWTGICRGRRGGRERKKDGEPGGVQKLELRDDLFPDGAMLVLLPPREAPAKVTGRICAERILAASLTHRGAHLDAYRDASPDISRARLKMEALATDIRSS